MDLYLQVFIPLFACLDFCLCSFVCLCEPIQLSVWRSAHQSFFFVSMCAHMFTRLSLYVQQTLFVCLTLCPSFLVLSAGYRETSNMFHCSLFAGFRNISSPRCDKMPQYHPEKLDDKLYRLNQIYCNMSIHPSATILTFQLM